MRSLSIPDREQVREHLITALEVYRVSGRDRGYAVSPAELDDVLDLYDLYDAAGGGVGVVLEGGGLADQLRQAIYDAYDFTQVGRKLSFIRAHLMRGVDRCPVCGISPPRELDHHLPRSLFRPLAIYVRNLIPMCHDCNHLKNRSASADPNRAFMHLYFERLPVQLLRVDIDIQNGALLAQYSVDPAANLSAEARARVGHQIERLRLNDRYAREINPYIISHATAVRMCFESGGAESVESFLIEQAAVEAGAFHANHWRPLLLRALANHVGFCSGECSNIFTCVN